MTHEEALVIILDGRNKHFDPDVLDALSAMRREDRRHAQLLAAVPQRLLPQQCLACRGHCQKTWSTVSRASPQRHIPA